MLVTRIFSFSHDVFRVVKRQHCVVKSYKNMIYFEKCLKDENIIKIINQAIQSFLPYLCCLGISNGDQLLCNYGQHLDINSIELVKAAPSSGLSQTREESAHHLKGTQLHFIIHSTLL